MFPNRLIRPLPKRRLKSRISEEQAEAITYPPVPASSSPLFGSSSSLSQRALQHPYYAEDVPLRYEHSDCGLNGDLDSGMSENGSDEYLDDRGQDKMLRYPSRTRAVHSATSSADGYESFENNNNKKKRKIPEIRGALSQDAALSDDATSEGAAGTFDDVVQTDGASEHATFGSGVGLSGAGRGRGPKPAKVMRERQPLSNSINQSNAAATPGQGMLQFDSNAPDLGVAWVTCLASTA